MDIVKHLMSGTIEYKDDTRIHHPPTALAIRAAKLLQTMNGTNQNNVAMIQSLQIREQEYLAELEALRNQLKEYHANNQSICDSKQETSDLGCADGQPPGSDRDSKGSGTAENSSSS